MPNILKRFMKPEVKPYQFPDTETLVMEPEPLPEEPVMEEVEESEQEAPPAPTSSQNPIDYAKLQAEAIMADAKQQAEEFLERAKADMGDELDQLREEARQAGYRDGFAQGVSSGMAETQSQREAQAVELGAEVRRFLEKANLAREEMMDQTQDELRDLAIAVAEKVVRVSLKSSGEIIARMIQGATEKLKRKEWVHIYIAGCDAKGMAQVTPGLTMSLAALSDHVKIVPMADDESGTCIIEMPDEIIDASAATQISNIRDLLSERPTGI